MEKYRIEKFVISDEFHISFFRDDTIKDYVKNNYRPEFVDPETIATFNTYEEAKTELQFENSYITVLREKSSAPNCYKVDLELVYIEKIIIDESGEINETKTMSYANFIIENPFN